MMDPLRSRSVAQDIQGLQALIRRHLDDREAIRTGHVRIIYFVDAHELKAYIHGVSRDYVEGFELGPERQLRALKDRSDLTSDLRLKCELAIRWLLFEQPHPVIVLPPHGLEIEEEIAYQQQRRVARDLGLLAEAQVQLRRLRERSFAKQWVSELATRALQGDEDSKRQLTEYLGRATPALSVVLSLLPVGLESIHSRIQRLVRDSRLATLSSIRWSDYGLVDSEIEVVRSVGLDETRTGVWHRRLEASRGNSERSNRLDAEAVSYVEGFNVALAKARIVARGILVTHTGTLIHAARDSSHGADSLLGVNNPVRHIRLLAWDSWAGSRTTCGSGDSPNHEANADDPLGDAVERLEKSLDVYNSKIDLRTEETPTLPVSEASALMEAWATFETARSALSLASAPDVKDDLIRTKEIERLLEWLRSERGLESLIAERLSGLVVTFGREVLTSEGVESLRVLVRATRPGRDGLMQIVPVAARLVGPIEVAGLEVERQERPDRRMFPAVGVELGDGSPRSYLSLALLHAAKDSLALAEVYAKASVDLADALRQERVAAEGRLLSAQVLRASSARSKSGESRSPDEVRTRLESASRLLKEAAAARPSPRVDLESAAVELERLVHNLDSDEKTRRRFARGLDTVEGSLPHAGEDVFIRLRIAELAVAYVVIDQMTSRDFGTEGLATPEFLRHWHNILIESVDHLRTNEDYLLEELPLMTRALEVIGYSLIHDQRVQANERVAVSGDCGIPNHLSLDIHSVQRGLARHDDRVSQILAHILADINARSGSSWTYSFVHAPVWERGDVERATKGIEDSILRHTIRDANRLLHRVGDDQRILLGDPEQIALLREAKKLYLAVLELVGESTDKEIRFLVNMEFCYACLLECASNSDKEDKEVQLRRLATRYETLLAEFGPRPTLLYRQSIVYGDLGMHERALAAIQQAQISSADDDRFAIGADWMKSTIQRRIGLHFSREAKDLLARLKLGIPSEDAYERYRATLQEAFRSTFEGFEDEPTELSLRGKAEMLRRLNNIVFYASLFIQAGGAISDLHPKFTDEKMKRCLQRLKAEAPAVEREWFYAHTIGAAHHALKEHAEAAKAADALLALLAASGASAQSESIQVAIDDAFGWKRGAASAGGRR